MLAQQLESLYVFAVWMLGDRQVAFEVMRSVLDKPPAERLPALAALLTGNKRPTGGINRFDELDGILRTNTTVPIDLGHPLVHGDPQRLSVLLSELQRTCLMATVRGLPPQRRAVFVLLHVMNLSVESCAEIVKSNPSAIRVAEIRARQTIEGYLASRCEHLDRGNTCHCIARLGGALEHGFVAWPEHDDHADVELGAPPMYRHAKDLYASLPRVRLPIVA